MKKLEDLGQEKVFLETSETGRSKPLERTILWDEYRIEVNPKNEKTHVFGLSYMEPYFPLNIDSPNPKAAIPSLFARLKDMVTTELIIVERQNGELDYYGTLPNGIKACE